MQRHGHAALSVAFATALFLLAVEPAAAQVRGGRIARNAAIAGPDDEASYDGVFLPPDRTAKRRLENAQELLQDRRFGEALRLLGSLVENDEDYFFKPNPDEPVFRSLKAAAAELIGSLPAEGLESYELQFGARARQGLKQAAAAGDLTGLAEISRRFFFTQAGQEATYLLSQHYLDLGRPLDAALALERLRECAALSGKLEPVLSVQLATCWLRAGKPEKAKTTLVYLKRSMPGVTVRVAGKNVQLFANDAEALAWLDASVGPRQWTHPDEPRQWTLIRGDESRNAPSGGGQPLLNVRWRQRVTDDRSVEKFVTKNRGDYLGQDVVTLPGSQPLAVNDVILMRTAFALQAVDFRTGKLIWKYFASDESYEQFLRSASTPQPGQVQQVYSGLDQRIWEDAIYGSLSSDGLRVYYIDDLGLAGVNSAPVTTVMPNGLRRYNATTRSTNCLAARELRTQGKLKWEVGGLTGNDEPRLAGAFFLGAPLPLQDHLYAMAEMKGQEIRLMVLSAKTGALEWSQQLALVDPTTTIVDGGARRNSGAMPSFADGVLVCPTSAGAVVGVNLATRSLLWGYQYPRGQQPTVDRFNALRFNINPDRRTVEHWADATVTIADGRALVTPVESDQIFCLNLTDGKELWKQSRGNNLYVGCVQAGNVFLVGHSSVSAVRLADGANAWPPLDLPSGSVPSGRGFYSGDCYYLPLSSAEVIKINVQTGKVEQRSRSRAGNIPGNLISYQDNVISQGVDYVDAYYEIDSLRKQIAGSLEKKPNDARALAALADVQLDRGLLGEAIDLFRRSYRLNDDPHMRGRLVECMLEGIRADFAAYRGVLGELSDLIDDPRHRLEFLRFKGLGLQASREILPAFEAYLALIDAEPPTTLDVIDEHRVVRRDRWVREQLAQLRAAASPDEQRQIDAEVGRRLQLATAADSPDALWGFLAVFAGLPTADQARAALIARLPADEILARTLLVRAADESAGQEAVATARRAELLRAANRGELAAAYYRQLDGKFADVVCGDGKTGRQCVAELRPADPVRKWLATGQAWPAGKVSSRQESKPLSRTAGPPARLQRPIDLDLIGPAGPLFEDVTLSIEYGAAQQQTLVAEDGWGGRRFRIPLGDSKSNSRVNPSVRSTGYNLPSMSYASVQGGLVVISTGFQLVAVDTLREDDRGASRVLWTQELNEQIGVLGAGQSVHSQPVPLPWGGTRYVPHDSFARRVGTIGPVHVDGVFFQRLNDLHCVDPLTGKTLWVRKGMGQGNDLFGDAELLFVAPATGGAATVLRASTGELLGTRPVVPFEKRMTTLGRRVLSWEGTQAGAVVQLRDLWLDEIVWSHSFGLGAKANLFGQEALAVLEPNGDFSLITLPDGKLLVHERLEPEAALEGIHLLRSLDGYLLATNGRDAKGRAEPGLAVQSIPNVANSPLISGRIYAFERETGKRLWPTPAVVPMHGLLLNQPTHLPVLVLARLAHRSGPTARDPKASLICIDKRTGQVVYQTKDELSGLATANYELSGDPATHVVTISLPPTVITLNFSDEAVGAPNPADSSTKP